MQHLKLGEGDFAWRCIPAIGGMTLGAFLSGCMEPMRQIRIGSICCGVAALVDLAYTFAVAQIALPWAVLAIFLTGLGMALIFPILALADMYPQQRGLASLLQAFTQLMTNTVVAGVLSPLLSEHPRDLAIGMTGFFLLGWLFLRWERRSGRRLRHRQATKQCLWSRPTTSDLTGACMSTDSKLRRDARKRAAERQRNQAAANPAPVSPIEPHAELRDQQRTLLAGIVRRDGEWVLGMDGRIAGESTSAARCLR